jgi:hypothetical protein
MNHLLAQEKRPANNRQKWAACRVTDVEIILLKQPMSIIVRNEID